MRNKLSIIGKVRIKDLATLKEYHDSKSDQSKSVLQISRRKDVKDYGKID